MSENNRFPIVLAHGIARFDILRELFRNKLHLSETDDRLHYFKGIKSHLEANGFEVHHTNVDFAGSVDLRATQLSKQLNKILEGGDAAKVNIIAHSMGGLDARHMIVDIDGMADKVASLTTIGTAHLGTSFADFALGSGGKLVISGLRPIINLEGFGDLTTEACESFNARARDNEAGNPVVYQTYASAEEHNRVFLPLQPSWFIVKHFEGENDGLVSVKSQQWESELRGADGRKKAIAHFPFPIPADHLNEVGWWDPQWTNPVSNLLGAGKQEEQNEYKIRDIYLDIARSL
jgi:triacylglycerol lipase